MPAHLFGLVGYPLGHSFSRQFFTDKFAREGIDADYLNFEIPSISMLPSVLEAHPSLAGFNVTIPYKQAVIPYLSALSPEAAAIGAVNVVKVLPSASGPRLIGYNTDALGFAQSLSPHLPKAASPESRSPDMRPAPDLRPLPLRALVLGSGGASRAVCYGLRSLGVDPVVVSRSPQPDASVPSLSYSALTPEVMAAHQVIVNATPLGMYPRVDDCPPIPYSLLTPAHVCFDLVYNPERTLFLQRAVEQGAAAIGGLEMLHLQALAAWDIWTKTP